MRQEGEDYLGDGLYASFDGYSFILRAPRIEGDHYVALEPEVLTAFMKYVEGVKEAMRHETNAQERKRPSYLWKGDSMTTEQDIKETANNIGMAVCSQKLTALFAKYVNEPPYIPEALVKDIFMDGFEAAQMVFRLNAKEVLKL